MTAATHEELLAYARKRWAFDPEFHARVHMGVDALVAMSPEEITDEARNGLMTAVAVGLSMQWVDILTGRITDD